MLSERGVPGYQAHSTGVRAGAATFDVPADLAFDFRHAIQIAAIVGVQTFARDLFGRQPDPPHELVCELGCLVRDTAGLDDVRLDKSGTEHGDFYCSAGQLGG